MLKVFAGLNLKYIIAFTQKEFEDIFVSHTCKYAPGCETKSSEAKDEPLLQVDTKTSLTCIFPGLRGKIFSFWLKSAVCFDIFFSC